MGKLDGKAALITGGARGQGRSHALAFAREGDDLKETVRLVERLDRRALSIRADVRNSRQVNAAVDQAISEFGKIDILIANAGIRSPRPLVDISDRSGT